MEEELFRTDSRRERCDEDQGPALLFRPAVHEGIGLPVDCLGEADDLAPILSDDHACYCQHNFLLLDHTNHAVPVAGLVLDAPFAVWRRDNFVTADSSSQENKYIKYHSTILVRLTRSSIGQPLH